MSESIEMNCMYVLGVWMRLSVYLGVQAMLGARHALRALQGLSERKAKEKWSFWALHFTKS